MTLTEKFRGVLVDVFKIPGRGTLLAFADGWSGWVRAGEKITVGGTELDWRLGPCTGLCAAV